MFVSLLETEDEGEFAGDTSAQDFAANFYFGTEMENTNLQPEEPRSSLNFLMQTLLFTPEFSS